LTVTLTAPARIPVTVIGGYLGAGKTTLVNHLLRTAGGRRLAILVNDFGDLPIDADLIEAESDNLISIAGGCVCCSFGSDLMGALMQMADRSPAPDHVLLETSGVALPGSVAQSVALIAKFRIDGVAVLVDAETVRNRAADPYMGDTITRQLAEADLVVLNKTDLIEANTLKDLRAWVVHAAPRARLIEAAHAIVPIELLLGFGGTMPVSTGALASGTIRPPEDAAARYESLSISITHPVNIERLAQALAQPDCGLLRAKGVLRDTDETLKSLQLVGARWDVADFTGAGPTGLALIGLRGHLNKHRIELEIDRANAANFR
jgi:G3E family GTPase